MPTPFCQRDTVKPHEISDFERGVREPDLLTLPPAFSAYAGTLEYLVRSALLSRSVHGQHRKREHRADQYLSHRGSFHGTELYHAMPQLSLRDKTPAGRANESNP